MPFLRLITITLSFSVVLAAAYWFEFSDLSDRQSADLLASIGFEPSLADVASSEPAPVKPTARMGVDGGIWDRLCRNSDLVRYTGMADFYGELSEQFAGTETSCEAMVDAGFVAHSRSLQEGCFASGGSWEWAGDLVDSGCDEKFSAPNAEGKRSRLGWTGSKSQLGVCCGGGDVAPREAPSCAAEFGTGWKPVFHHTVKAATSQPSGSCEKAKESTKIQLAQRVEAKRLQCLIGHIDRNFLSHELQMASTVCVDHPSDGAQIEYSAFRQTLCCENSEQPPIRRPSKIEVARDKMKNVPFSLATRPFPFLRR